MELAILRNQLGEHYNNDELKDLCFDLSIDYENLPGESKAAKVRELLYYMADENQLAGLFESLAKDRPHVDWPDDPDEVASLTKRLKREAKWVHWQRQILLLIGVATLLGIVVIIWFVRPKSTPPTIPEPDAGNFRSVESNELQVFDLALDPDGITLWLTALDKQSEEWGLYHLDTSTPATASLVKQNYGDQYKDTPIFDLVIDCQGYIWLLLENVGPLIIEVLQFNETTAVADLPDWPVAWRTAYSAATHCYDNSEFATVWLGRDGIVALNYPKDKPFKGNISVDSHDLATQFGQDYLGILGLHYDVEHDTIWAVDDLGHLLSIPLAGIQEPVEIPLDQFSYSLTQDANDTLWVGVEGGLAYGVETFKIVFPENSEETFGSITAVAAGDPWVWAGGQCYEDETNCAALGVFANDTLSPVKFGPNAVNAIEIDSQGNTWFGTDRGLVYYPSED